MFYKRQTISVVLIIVLSFFANTRLNAQDGGCDLCGPDIGSNRNIASGNYSATIGVSCESKGAFSFAVGYLAKTYATNTIAMGKYVKAQSTNSIVIGTGFSNLESRMLINSIPNSLMIGFNSSVPTLFVSNSSGFNTTGKVGIGNVTNPKTKLHIKSDTNEDAGVFIEPSNLAKTAYIQLFNENNKICAKQDAGLSIISQEGSINLDADNVMMNAKVSINATRPFAEGYDYALAVSGGILTTKVLVKEVTEWYDHVFDDEYKLIAIDELSRFVKENGHLPDMPSEYNVLDKGYDMVEMDGLLLKKIEELTLYTIELNALIKQQQELIDSLLTK